MHRVKGYQKADKNSAFKEQNIQKIDEQNLENILFKEDESKKSKMKKDNIYHGR